MSYASGHSRRIAARALHAKPSGCSPTVHAEQRSHLPCRDADSAAMYPKRGSRAVILNFGLLAHVVRSCEIDEAHSQCMTADRWHPPSPRSSYILSLHFDPN